MALGPVHGYAIAQRLEQVSQHVVQVPQGSLYPALHRLENRGLLAADWKDTETGREAKFYRLDGKRASATRNRSGQLGTVDGGSGAHSEIVRKGVRNELVATTSAPSRDGREAGQGTAISSGAAYE